MSAHSPVNSQKLLKIRKLMFQLVIVEVFLFKTEDLRNYSCLKNVSGSFYPWIRLPLAMLGWAFCLELCSSTRVQILCWQLRSCVLRELSQLHSHHFQLKEFG